MSDTVYRTCLTCNGTGEIQSRLGSSFGVDQCSDCAGWRCVPVEIDYEALATRIQEDDDMAGHIIVSHSEYVKLARSYAETLGIGGDDEA
jgi:hypothetical protein